MPDLPNHLEVRQALATWRGTTGLRMDDITIHESADPRYGLHWYVTTTFREDDEIVGRFRVRYCASGEVHLDYAKLDDEIQAEGRMSELLADSLPWYRRWGLDRVTMDAHLPAGAAFAEAQGMERESGVVYAMTVPDGPVA